MKTEWKVHQLRLSEMAKDKVVRRRKPGFLEKLGNNAAGAAGGLALFLVSFYILYSNEVSVRRFLDVVKRYRPNIRPGSELISYSYIGQNLSLSTGGKVSCSILLE